MGGVIVLPQTAAGKVFTIGDLAPEVIEKSENRGWDLERSYQWLRSAVLEITSNQDLKDEFDELEVLGPDFVLTPGTSEYDFSNLTPTGDLNQATLTIRLYDPATGRWERLRDEEFEVSDRMTPTSGKPSRWYRFGNMIGFNRVPDKAYTVKARMLRYHPINEDAVLTTPILIGKDWHEILILAAVERGFIENSMYEKASAIHQALFGDPKGKGEPGLIKGRKKRRSKERWRTQKGLKPVIQRYGY